MTALLEVTTRKLLAMRQARRECTMQCAMFLKCDIKSLMLRHAYKKAATKAPKPTMEPAAILRLAAAPAELSGAPVPEAVEEAPEPEAPVPEADESESVALALLEAAEPVGSFRRIVVELLALTTRVRVELPLPATGIV